MAARDGSWAAQFQPAMGASTGSLYIFSAENFLLITSRPAAKLQGEQESEVKYYKMRTFIYCQRVSECDADVDLEESTVTYFATQEEKGR
ncbi:hypothetical protein EJB05_10174, partial [Eragrostis curvula]